MAINWKAYLPLRELPDTGDKDFKKGEVYAANVEGRASVARVTTHKDEEGYVRMEVLAGDAYGLVACDAYGLVACDSDWAKHSVLIRPEFAEKPFPNTGDLAARLRAEEPAQVTKAPQERPRWLDVVDRVLLKADAHRRAGRVGVFKQCFVPMADYEALVEHFGESGASVWTCLGMINVYPLNADNTTFSE